MLIILVILGLLFAYGAVLYNNLVALRENVKKNWANIDVLLKQRHDELPKLVETCKQYMGYEQETLRQVMEARTRVSQAQQSGSVDELGKAESQLRLGLGNLFAVAEQYPDLKANESFQHLQKRITGLEESIADRREFYNESVNLNNIRIAQFPDMIIANLFNFEDAELLEFTEEEISDVSMKALFE
ncbi:MAG: LemA family protein [Gammaproteobacteria bacterium]|nr:LemA family protein [Gammaproteobacteria bacterium]